MDRLLQGMCLFLCLSCVLGTIPEQFNLTQMAEKMDTLNEKLDMEVVVHRQNLVGDAKKFKGKS
jgi:hypothetical protein